MDPVEKVLRDAKMDKRSVRCWSPIVCCLLCAVPALTFLPPAATLRLLLLEPPTSASSNLRPVS